RCGLFSAPVRAALIVGRNQARRVAAQAGAAEAYLADLARRAQASAAVADCASPQMAAAAGRVAEGFSGYARLQRMRFPGEIADWQADRGDGAATRWRLAQVSPTDGAARLG